MGQQAALERQALEQLRRGDLRGAHGTLGVLAQLRPGDQRLQRRLKQVAELIAKRNEARERMRAEPLRYAHAYIKAGRLQEGLRLLRAALARDPENERLRTLALQVARRLKATSNLPESGSYERQAAEDRLRAETEARRRAPSSAANALSAPVGMRSTQEVERPELESEGYQVRSPVSEPASPFGAPPAPLPSAPSPVTPIPAAPTFPPPPAAPAAFAPLEPAVPYDPPAAPAPVPELSAADKLRDLLVRVRSRRRAPSALLS